MHACRSTLEDPTDWFKLARQADPSCKLYLNDFGIFDGGPSNEHRAHFYATLKSLKEKGAPLDGIGIQSHFAAALPSPAQLLQVLDQFATIGLPIESTEVSINTPDRELQADYMRDYMIAVFSHPNVQGIMLWGFWAGRHWRPEAGLWAQDWALRPAGQAWIDLVDKQWKTDATATTADDGSAKVRGFAGEYEIAVTVGGREKIVRATLPANGASVTVRLD